MNLAALKCLLMPEGALLMEIISDEQCSVASEHLFEKKKKIKDAEKNRCVMLKIFMEMM